MKFRQAIATLCKYYNPENPENLFFIINQQNSDNKNVILRTESTTTLQSGVEKTFNNNKQHSGEWRYVLL
jgi:hypothetical protein